MVARVQLNNFRFSIYIDADGTVTLTDLPAELRDVVAALDPTHQWANSCALPVSPAASSPPDGLTRHQTAPEDGARAAS
jgi:hypothetical protein